MSLGGFLQTGNLVDFLETKSSDTELSDLKIKAESMKEKIEAVITDLEKRYELARKYAFDNITPLTTLETNMLEKIESIVQSHYNDFKLKVDSINNLYETKVQEAVATTANNQTLLLQEQTEIWKKIVKNFRSKITGFDELFTRREEFRERNFYEWKKQVNDLLEEYRGFIGAFEDYMTLENDNIEKREKRFSDEMEKYKTQCAKHISEIAESYELAEKKRSADTKNALDQAIVNQGRSFQAEKVKWITEANGKVAELTTQIENGVKDTEKAKAATAKLNKAYAEKTTEYEQLKNDTTILLNSLKETNQKLVKSLREAKSVVV